MGELCWLLAGQAKHTFGPHGVHSAGSALWYKFVADAGSLSTWVPTCMYYSSLSLDAVAWRAPDATDGLCWTLSLCNGSSLEKKQHIIDGLLVNSIYKPRGSRFKAKLLVLFRCN